MFKISNSSQFCATLIVFLVFSSNGQYIITKIVIFLHLGSFMIVLLLCKIKCQQKKSDSEMKF